RIPSPLSTSRSVRWRGVGSLPRRRPGACPGGGRELAPAEAGGEARSDEAWTRKNDQKHIDPKEPPMSANRHPFFIACARNLEPMLVSELAELGVAGARAGHLGVEAELSRDDVYRVA